MLIYHIYLCIRWCFNPWINQFFPCSSYTWLSPKKLSGLVSYNRHNLFYVSVRSTCVSIKQFNSICSYQRQLCILICFIRCFKHIKLWVRAIMNIFSLIHCGSWLVLCINMYVDVKSVLHTYISIIILTLSIISECQVKKKTLVFWK